MTEHTILAYFRTEEQAVEALRRLGQLSLEDCRIRNAADKGILFTAVVGEADCEQAYQIIRACLEDDFLFAPKD